MGIPVTCPQGHQFKVKDKYAGKKGLCPFCEGQVLVRVPDALSSESVLTAVHRAVAADHGSGSGIHGSVGSSSVLDDAASLDSSTSGSLLGSSVIRHDVKCRCGESVPMWFAKCPNCGQFMPTR